MKVPHDLLFCLLAVCLCSLFGGCSTPTSPPQSVSARATASPSSTAPVDTTPAIDRITVIQQAGRFPVQKLLPTDPQEYVYIPEVEMKGVPSFYKAPQAFQQGTVTPLSAAPLVVLQAGQALLVTYTDTLTFEPPAQPLTVWNFQVCEKVGTFTVGSQEDYVVVSAKDIGNMIAFWIARDNTSGSGDTFSPQKSYGGTLLDLQPSYPYPAGMTVSNPFPDAPPPSIVATACQRPSG
jgi:hypothetical protein